MATENLLDLDVDVLFEQQNVPNIDKEHRRIVSVIEDKREELRTLVGGRYRDLLQAADTITKMQESSSCLVDELKEIAHNCNVLNERQLIGFKSPDGEPNVKNQTTQYFSSMLQIKLLCILPELIWTNIDKKNYSSAAALYILSRHISTGLRLDTQNQLQQKLPVGLKQWNMLKSYYTTIKHYVHGALKTKHLDTQDVDNHLLSLLLLDNSDLNAVLKTFLSLRYAAYLQCLKDVGGKRLVKELILASLELLTDSIEIVNYSFLEHGKLHEKLVEMSEDQNPPLLALIELKDVAKYAKYLPEVIRNYHVKCKLQALDMKQARVEFEKWLHDIELLQGELNKLIKVVTTLQFVQEIKIIGANYQKQHNFSHIAEYLQLEQQLDLFAWLYSPLLNKRFCAIIAEKWYLAVEEILLAIKQHLHDLQHAKQITSMWQEDVSEIPESLAVALSKSCHDKKLLMRTKGYSKILMQICLKFDEHAKYIAGEIDKLMMEEQTTPEEKNEILEFLGSTTQQHISKLIEALRKLETSSMKEMLFLCLYWTGLIELCPHLKSCLNAHVKWRPLNKSHSGVDVWKVICEQLRDESLYYWSLLLDNLLREIAVEKYLPVTLGHNMFLQDCARWQTIESEQCNDENESVCTSFSIPSQPCISLQRYIFDLIGALNNYVPQTLPHRVLLVLHTKMLQSLVNHYQRHLLPADSSESLKQNTALQMYFDLCFLHEMFALSLQKNATLKMELQVLQQNCKTLVDPIDFELFLEYIMANVKLSSLRFNSQFGLLTSNHSMEQITTKEKNANVLTLSDCNSTLWFSLLPIVNTTQKPTVVETKNYQAKTASSQKDRTKKNENTTTGGSSSSSSSFFW